jgi:hypothetical protein
MEISDLGRVASAAWDAAAAADGRVAALCGMAAWFVVERVVGLAMAPIRKAALVLALVVATAVSGAFVAEGVDVASRAKAPAPHPNAGYFGDGQ